MAYGPTTLLPLKFVSDDQIQRSGTPRTIATTSDAYEDRDDNFSVLTRNTTGYIAPDPSKSKSPSRLSPLDEYGEDETEAEAVKSAYRRTSMTSMLSPANENISLSNYSQAGQTEGRTSPAWRAHDDLAADAEDSGRNRSTRMSEDADLERNGLGEFNDKSEVLLAQSGDGRMESRGISDLEYQDPSDTSKLLPPPFARTPEKQNVWTRTFGSGAYPVEQRIENKRRGIGRQRYPFVAWALTIAMAGLLIDELVVNATNQGSPVSFKPTVNPMLGPSSSALINMGARFAPCMKDVAAVPVTLTLPCLNDTANPPDQTCPISDLCGFGGIPADKTPNQWFRFITPIFLHAGIIHYLLNMSAQLTVSAQIEREMGSAGFLVTYFAAGIFGNVLGGNFALVGIPSVGASGAIFGTVAVTWVDLFAHWRYQYRPKMKLTFMIIELLIGIAVGFVPFVDNFVHLGGFLMGLLVGTTFYPVISITPRHRYVMWAFRLIAIPLSIVLFVVLTRNFYTSDPYAACSWCRYLSCFPTSSNNRCKGTGISVTTTNS